MRPKMKKTWNLRTDTPDPEMLKAELEYSPRSGILRWRNPRRGRRHNGIAGSVLPVTPKKFDGLCYIRVTIDGTYYLAHNVIWAIMTGHYPTPGREFIDHKDLCGTNNRWSNLRICDQIQNHANTGARRNSTSGIKGIHVRTYKSGKKVFLMHPRGKYLGVVKDLETARRKVLRYYRKLAGEFARV